MVFKRVAIFAGFALLLSISLVCATICEVKPARSAPTRPTLTSINGPYPSDEGYLLVSAYYGVSLSNGSSVGGLVNASVIVTGPESFIGTTNPSLIEPLFFVMTPGTYNVSGNYGSTPQLNETVWIPPGGGDGVFFNFGSTPPPALPITDTEGMVAEPLKTVVAQGYIANITVTTLIEAVIPPPNENFTFSVYANATLLVSENFTLSGFEAVSVQWDTSGWVYGNYNIFAEVTPTPNESCVPLNCTGGNVIVTIPGDVNGDFKVDMQDITLVARAFGSTPSSNNWNPNADINNDGKVDMRDIALVARNFGQHYP